MARRAGASSQPGRGLRCSSTGVPKIQYPDPMIEAPGRVKDLAGPPIFATAEEERRHRKVHLAGAFRLFARFGFDEGVAGHITARDPEHSDWFWANPFGMHFSQIRASDLVLVNDRGEVIHGEHPVNTSAFAIHSRVHAARPDAVAAAHAHSIHGKAWASLGRLLDPITQDSCAFYQDHGLFDDFTGVVYETSEGDRIARALGKGKALILRNHGVLSVGQTAREAFVLMKSLLEAAHIQLTMEATGGALNEIPAEICEKTARQYEHHDSGRGSADWPAYLRLLDGVDTGWRS